MTDGAIDDYGSTTDDEEENAISTRPEFSEHSASVSTSIIIRGMTDDAIDDYGSTTEEEEENTIIITPEWSEHAASVSTGIIPGMTDVVIDNYRSTTEANEDSPIIRPVWSEHAASVSTGIIPGSIARQDTTLPSTMGGIGEVTPGLTQGDPGGGRRARSSNSMTGDGDINTSRVEFKTPKKYKPQSPKRPVTTAATTTATVPDEDDSAECPICFEEWSNTGEHRLASLKCGHLFGSSCIEKWLREQKPGKCPQCKAKAVKKDIRLLFAKTLKTVDTADRDAAVTALEKEREARRMAEMEAAQNRLRIQLAQDEVRKLQQELQQSKQREANARLTAPVGMPLSQGMSSSQGLHNSQSSSQTTQVKKDVVHKGYVFDQIIKVWEAGNCRVLTYDVNSGMVVVSQPSASPLFPGYGIKKINALDFRTMQFVPIHQKVIRDIAFNPATRDGLLLSGSLDKMVKVTSMPSSTVVQTYTCPAPVWSCTWNPDNTNLLYAGLANGTVSVFDTRNTSNAVNQINTQGPGSPVVSLQYMARDPHSTFRPGGLLVGQLNHSTFYEYKTNEYTPHALPMESGLTYLSVDNKSRHVLASYRQSQRATGVRHMVYQMSAKGVVGTLTESVCGANLIHTFHGGSTQKLLSRSKLLHHPADHNKLLVCAPDEASLSLQIWDTATGNLCQKLPTQDEILDLSQVAINGSHYLAALTEKAIRLYKWIV